MLLCVDIGNTNLVIGLFENDKLVISFSLESNLNQTKDEYGVKILDMINYNNLDKSKITGVIISSVVPTLDVTFEKMFLKYFGIKPLFVGPGIKTGIRINTDNPKQVGADIIIGAVAAVAKYGAPVIIIDMGTAITLFYVDEKKELLGGIIAPGIKISYDSLFKKTSKLEEVKFHEPINVIGRDTVGCIQSAMLYGTASMIDGLIKKMKKEINRDDIKVVLTGGEARYIRHLLEEETIYYENLLLDGLLLTYNKNK